MTPFSGHSENGEVAIAWSSSDTSVTLIVEFMFVGSTVPEFPVVSRNASSGGGNVEASFRLTRFGPYVVRVYVLRGECSHTPIIFEAPLVIGPFAGGDGAPGCQAIPYSSRKRCLRPSWLKRRPHTTYCCGVY